MMRHRPGDQPGPFTAAELEGIADVAPDELAGDRRVARQLEAIADRGTVRPSADFADRVMAAIAAEPGPAPARAAGAAVRRGSLGAFLASFRDAWRVSFGTGFPVAARAQALALVLVVSAVFATSGLVTAGALGAFTDHGPAPATSVEPASPVVTLAPTPSPAPSEVTGPTSGSIAPDETGSPEPSPSEATESPAETPDATSGDGGSGDGGSGDNNHAPGTPRPTRTPDATWNPTPSGDDDHHSPRPSRSPWPTHTPWPTGTPAPEGDPTPTPGH